MSEPPAIVVRDGGERPALAEAWRGYHESPAVALAIAEICRERALARDDVNLRARALALAAAVAMHCGQTERAAGHVEEARALAAAEVDPRTGADVAAVAALLGFHTGDYALARAEAERAVRLADASGDLLVRIRARRATCVIYGNLQLPDLRVRVEELLALAIMTDEPWEEAISRNDLACTMIEAGDLAGAERETARALKLLGPAADWNSFATAVILTTRAEIRLLDGRAEEALADTDRGIELLLAPDEPDPYVLAAIVGIQVQALGRLGRPAAAAAAGTAALERIGTRVPHTRARLLQALADALADSGQAAAAERMRASAARALIGQSAPAPGRAARGS